MGWRHEETKDLIWEAIDALKENRVVDAITILERAGRPKFHSSSHAAEEYARKRAKDQAKAREAASVAFAEAS